MINMATGMKSMWGGTIGFSLVSIPIRLYKATQDNDLHFHLIHANCNGRVEMKRICSKDGQELEWADLHKGWDYGGDELLPLTDEELASMMSTKSIEIREFVKLSDIDPIAFESSYFVEPQAGAKKAYALLYRALCETGLVAVAQMVMRTKEYLVTIRPVGGVLLLTTMFWPDELRSPASLDATPDVALNPAELRLATNLVKTLTEKKFDYTRFRNVHREELATALQARVKAMTSGRKPPKITPSSKTPTQAGTDILAQLQASVRKSQEAKVAAKSTTARKSA